MVPDFREFMASEFHCFRMVMSQGMFVGAQEDAQRTWWLHGLMFPALSPVARLPWEPAYMF